MASMASVSQFTFKTFQNSSPISKLIIPSSSHSVVRRINVSITKYTKLQKRNFVVRAAGEEANPLEEAKPPEGVMEGVDEEVLDENLFDYTLKGVPLDMEDDPLEGVPEEVTEANPYLEGVTEGVEAVMEANPSEKVPEGIMEADSLNE